MKRILNRSAGYLYLYPIRILSVGIVFTLVLFALMGWNIWREYVGFTKIATDELNNHRLSSIIIYHDEVLTMSTRMAAATGDLQWEARYRDFEVELEDAINDIIKLVPEVQGVADITQTNEANIKLVEMEKQAFDLVHRNQKDAALKILSSEEYKKQKKIYSEGIWKTMDSAGKRVESQKIMYRRHTFLTCLFAVFIVTILIFGWFGITMLMRKYIKKIRQSQDEVQKANEELEKRVEDKTLALRISNDELFTENVERKKVELENATLLEETQHALEELKKTQSYLLQSEKMASVGQLAAGVAHEINNPTGFVNSNLNSLSKYSNKMLELMRKYEEGLTSFKDNGNEKIVSFCEEIDEFKKKFKIDFIIKDFQKTIADSLEGTQRIKKIVADLKSFSRVDQEELKPANINEGIESTLNVVWNELKYKCTVEKNFGDLPQIYCNLGQLNQVFVNLLINAAHAIEKKGTITISTRYVNGNLANNHTEQNYVEVKISDTGKGIPEDKLDRIFEPFFTTKDVGKGTGLGLSIAYDIIKEKHTGEIEVESKLGEGTTFTIKLPMLEGEQKAS